jgi:hypothetical protein
MSKKSRKKSTRASSVPRVSASNTAVAASSSGKTNVKVPAIAVRSYMSSEELAVRYKYVKDDLKLIAIIAIPMVLGLIIASFFVKV